MTADRFLEGIMVIFRTISQILAAGIAINAFSLLLFASSFNLKDRVTRSFVLILICVMVIFSADALGSSSALAAETNFWLRIQWFGLVYLPPSFIYFSDAVLETTGKPSRGKRRWAVRFAFLISTGIFFSLPVSWFLSSLLTGLQPAAGVLKIFLTILFLMYYFVSMAAAWFNLIRAYRRTSTPSTRRRIGYLLWGSLAPALGSMPYLLFGSQLAQAHNLIFWFIVALSNLFTGGLLTLMAYAIAFFGVTWPDRVIKRRLFKWIMRGPITAILVLGITTIMRRGVAVLNVDATELIPVVMVLAIILMEFLINIFAPYWERWLFFGKDRSEIDLMNDLGDRLFTRNDLEQYLETIMSAISDRFRSKRVFIASFDHDHLTTLVSTVVDIPTGQEQMQQFILSQDIDGSSFSWDGYTLFPLKLNQNDHSRIVGIVGLDRMDGKTWDEDDQQVFRALCDRILQALQNRELQNEIYNAVREFNPQVEQFQRLSAESRFADADELADQRIEMSSELATQVKDALTHFWGGPKLSDSPLTQLDIVRQAADDGTQTPANALRAVLKTAIERIKPSGERKFTGEWLLYNILELKFIQGKKVREVAMRLAVSEADLYRKQRVAIEAVAKEMMDMENQTSKE